MASTGVTRTGYNRPNAAAGGDSASSRIANLTPEERQALQARILARKQNKAEGQLAATSATLRTNAAAASTVPASPSSSGGQASSGVTPSRVQTAGNQTSYTPISTPNKTYSNPARIPASPSNPPAGGIPPSTVAQSSAMAQASAANIAANQAIARGRHLGARGDSLTRYTNADGKPVLAVDASPPNVPSVAAGSASAPRGIPGSTGAASLRNLPRREMEPVQRRPSIQIIEKEKKTDYWKDVAQVAQTEAGATVKSEDLNTVISRAMSLGIVGDKKQRQSLSAPKAQEVLQQVAQMMETRVVELSGQAPAMNPNTSLMEKILNLEKTLTTLEAKKSKEEEDEKQRVQTKIGELEASLRALESQKAEQRAKNRQTMQIEIENLKEMMAKVQEQQNPAAESSAKDMASKMARLEAALRLMNEERKKESTDDKETVVLKRKLQLFEQKLKDMEEEKKLREEAENSGALREKLILMEDKLAKMERRKSLSLTQEMQNKMEAVEKQLAMLRTERANGHAESINTKIAQKMQILEKQLKEMATQQIVVNDPETVALRNHISKLEETIVSAEQRMESQRQKSERVRE